MITCAMSILPAVAAAEPAPVRKPVMHVTLDKMKTADKNAQAAATLIKG